MDSLQTNTSVVSSILGLDNQLLWRWYRDHLSGFRESEQNGSHYQHDLQLSKNETVRVPIFKPENIGPAMAIDEKQIGEEMHTLVSNRESGKIALMVRSMRYADLQKVLNKEDLSCRKVEILTRDLSPLYAKVGNELFFNSSPIADKFHIIRSLMEACQDVRVRLRQDKLREKRICYEIHKKQEKEYKKECLLHDVEYIKKTFKYKEPILENGETVLEGLARSRYLLFIYSHDWTLSQRNRAFALFEKFPEIKKVYDRACEFRDWMKKENVGKSIRLIKQNLNTWFAHVEKDDIDEMLNFKSLVERNTLPILNYFRFGATNAIAENINSRIQRFIMINQGTRDREFFYFRIGKYFSSTSI
ncbi:MAG: transposase [Candidatus Symbiothrix sp.]|nr:transposase [Candidatus Symbiothrix sp.]